MNAPKLSVNRHKSPRAFPVYIVYDLPVRFVHFPLVEVDVDVRHGVAPVAQYCGDGLLGNIQRGGDGGLGMSRPIGGEAGE